MPTGARRARTLQRPTYEDAFEVAVRDAHDRTAEVWLRLMLEGSPERAQRALRGGWRALGLQHGPLDCADHVLGWPIRRSEPNVVLVGASSRVGMPAELLLMREAESIKFFTFIRHENPLVRVAWAPIVKPHHEVVTRLLGRMARQA